MKIEWCFTIASRSNCLRFVIVFKFIKLEESILTAVVRLVKSKACSKSLRETWLLKFAVKRSEFISDSIMLSFLFKLN